jgi:hypothetical protein
MMVEAVVEEPLVLLVKLADRLHNMRTVYALPPSKQVAVAEETLEVWCSMAAYLGWYGLKVGPGKGGRETAREGAGWGDVWTRVFAAVVRPATGSSPGSAALFTPCTLRMALNSARQLSLWTCCGRFQGSRRLMWFS